MPTFFHSRKTKKGRTLWVAEIVHRNKNKGTTWQTWKTPSYKIAKKVEELFRCGLPSDEDKEGQKRWYDIVNDKDINGRTYLHRLAMENEEGYSETWEQLLAIGADVNAKDRNGKTPLMLTHDSEIAKMLIEHGADINAKDNQGKTVLDMVKTNEIRDFVLNAEKIRSEYLAKHPEEAKQESSPKKKSNKARQGLVALLDSLNKQPATPERKAAKETAVKAYRKAHPKSAERG